MKKILFCFQPICMVHVLLLALNNLKEVNMEFECHVLLPLQIHLGFSLYLGCVVVIGPKFVSGLDFKFRANRYLGNKFQLLL